MRGPFLLSCTKIFTKNVHYAILLSSAEHNMPTSRDQLKSKLLEWLAAKKNAAEAKSAENKLHTAAKKLIVAYFASEGKPPGSAFEVTDGYFDYLPATTSRIKPEAWYKLWQDGEIDEKQFFEGISVTKEVADHVIGGDQVIAISEDVLGKTPSIRFKEGVPAITHEQQKLLPAPVKPVKPARPLTIGVQPSATPVKPLRQITLRKKP